MSKVRRFEVVNLAAIRAALDSHNSSCQTPARAILLNPVDHGLLGWEELWGLPVLPDDRVKVKHGRIDCEAHDWQVEEVAVEPVDASSRHRRTRRNRRA